MKKLILLVTLLTGVQSLAADIAKYNFAIGGEKRGEYHNFEIIIDSDATAKISKTSTIGTLPFYVPVNGEAEITKDEMELSKPLFRMVKNHILSLSQVEVKKTISEIVCMMMPSPELSNDHLSIAKVKREFRTEYYSDLILILGPQGCWNRVSISPKSKNDLQVAKELKQVLKTIAVTHFNKDL